MGRYLGIEAVDQKPYVFISYNSEDDERLSRIVKILQRYNLNMWYDGGIERITEEEWQEQIALHIREAEVVFFFISNGIFSKENSFVRMEYSVASRHQKQVCVVMLDNIDSKQIPAKYDFWWEDINRKQCIMAADMADEEIAKAIRNECCKIDSIRDYITNTSDYLRLYHPNVVYDRLKAVNVPEVTEIKNVTNVVIEEETTCLGKDIVEEKHPFILNISLEGDNGESVENVECKLIDRIPVGYKEYAVFLPTSGDQERVVILRKETEDGETETFVSVNQKELDEVYDLFKKRNAGRFDFVEKTDSNTTKSVNSRSNESNNKQDSTKEEKSDDGGILGCIMWLLLIPGNIYIVKLFHELYSEKVTGFQYYLVLVFVCLSVSIVLFLTGVYISSSTKRSLFIKLLICVVALAACFLTLHFSYALLIFVCWILAIIFIILF